MLQSEVDEEEEPPASPATSEQEEKPKQEVGEFVPSSSKLSFLKACLCT